MSINVRQATNTNDPTGFTIPGLLTPMLCGSLLVVGVNSVGSPGADPGTINSIISDKGDVFLNISGYFTQLLGPDPSSETTRSSVWACLSSQSGATRIDISTNLALGVSFSFWEVTSSLGAFAVDDIQGVVVDTSGYPIVGPSLASSGNALYVSVLSASLYNLIPTNFPPWAANDIGPHTLSGWLVGTGTQQMIAGNALAIADAYSGAGVAFKEIVAAFPDLSRSPTALDFSGSGSQNVGVSNLGGGTLDFTASVDKPWASVLPTSGTAPATLTVTVNQSLAPAPQPLLNGDFETGTLAGWASNFPVGGVAPSATAAHPESGDYSAVMGVPSDPEQVNGGYTVSQDFDVAPGAVLSLWYWLYSDFKGWPDNQRIEIRDTSDVLLHTLLFTWDDIESWTHITYNLSAYAGQTIRLWMNVHSDGSHSSHGATLMYVDNITVLPAATAVYANLTVTGDDCVTQNSPALVPISLTASSVDATLSSVVASPTTALAGTVSTVKVTLLSSSGIPVPGKAVSLSGTGAATIGPASGVSDSNGIVTFAVSSTAVELDVFTATDSTDSVVLTQTAAVQFTGYVSNLTVFSPQGPCISNAHIYVLNNRTGIVPSPKDAENPVQWSLAPIFDSSGSPLAQPVLSNGLGMASYYASQGLVTVVVCNQATVMLVLPDQRIPQ